MAMLWISISAFAYDFEVDGVYYNITSMSNLEVGVTNKDDYYGSFYRNTSYVGNITIPETVNYNNRTYTVTSIEKSAFGSPTGAYDSNIDNHGCKITSINLPSSIRIIDDYAFKNCRELSKISFPASLETIGNFSFSYSSINEMILPESLETIGDYSFFSSSIKEVIIPNNVRNIGKGSFSDCKLLANVIIGKNVTEIGKDAFLGDSKLVEVFCTGINRANGMSREIFINSHPALEIYVPSVEVYGFGREYLSFPTYSFDYTGQSHNIEWTNNLKAYKCEISESECQTDVNAGQYTKTLKATYSNGVDFSVEIPYEYTINKVPMTLSVNDVQREYGDPNPSFTCNISGFVKGENEQTLGTTPAFECEATQISKVGNYRILASLNAPNYEITYNYGTLTIEKAPLTATVSDLNKIYGNENPDFSLSYSGLKNNETSPEWSVVPKFSTTATVASGAGKYTVTASDGVAVNYEVTKYNPGTLSISKRDLTAKANDCERLYGEENPQFRISYVGFVNGDSETSFVQKPSAECTATKASNAGTYPIVVTGGEAENYNFIYQDGSLKINPLTVGFKDVYNSVPYNDMSLSTTGIYFNYVPEIVGPYSEDDFWIELWFLDKDNKYDQHVAAISGGDYAGNYVNTNLDCPMWAGKYIFNLISTGTNPNVVANPSRAYLTVNRTSNNLEWNADSPISVKVGEKVDLGITYQADLWCTFNTDYNEEFIELSSEGETGNNPHWFAKGLKEGETTLYFGIECQKNDMGFYDFTDSRTLSKKIKIKASAGLEDVVADSDSISVMAQNGSVLILNKDDDSVVRVFTLQGVLLQETKESTITGLNDGLYIITVDNHSFKVGI